MTILYTYTLFIWAWDKNEKKKIAEDFLLIYRNFKHETLEIKRKWNTLFYVRFLWNCNLKETSVN